MIVAVAWKATERWQFPCTFELSSLGGAGGGSAS